MDSSTASQCSALENAVGGAQRLANITGSRAYEVRSNDKVLSRVFWQKQNRHITADDDRPLIIKEVVLFGVAEETPTMLFRKLMKKEVEILFCGNSQVKLGKTLEILLQGAVQE